MMRASNGFLKSTRRHLNLINVNFIIVIALLKADNNYFLKQGWKLLLIPSFDDYRFLGY